MTRALTYLALILALLTGPVWAGSEQPTNPADFGFGSTNLTDGNTDTYLYTFNATQAIGGGADYLQGVAYAGGYFWISSAGTSLENPADNMIYKLTSLGVLVGSFRQPNVGSGYGFRDLTWDGTYLYGACGECPYLVAFDLEGHTVPSMYVPKPPYTTSVNGVAYNPTLDHFWLGSSTGVWEFDRQGNTIWQGTVGPSNYQRGLAFDYGVGGPFLWMFDAYGNPATTLRKFNPITHTLIYNTYAISQFTGCGGQVAGGLEATHEYNPAYWALVGLALGSPYDWCFVWQIRTYMDPQAPAAPTGFEVTDNGPALAATLSWTNPTLNAGGTTLSSIEGIIIKREGAVIDTIPGDPGQAMVYNDHVPTVGDYDYQLNCYNRYGNSNPAYAGTWIGLDAPNPVSNLTGAGVGTSLIAHLTWTNPTTGQHGGYFTPQSIIGYRIKRYNQTGHLDATFHPSGLLTEYTDSTVAVLGWYSYTVSPMNHSGSGYNVETPLFQIGPTEFVEYPYYWVEISDIGINTGINDRDQNVGPFSLDFTYNFYGTPFDNIRICSNGFASFTSTSGSHENVPIPTQTEPNNMIAPLWRLLTPIPFGGDVWYLADSANHRFIVEWDSLAMIGYKEWLPVNMEAIIYENGYIDFMYQTYIDDWPHMYTIGIENSTGMQGVQCGYNGSGPILPAPNTGVRILNQFPELSGLELTLTPLELAVSNTTPQAFTLKGIYPNPFNPKTAISYQLSVISFVNLSVYDISGRKVVELVNGWREAGSHQVTFDGSQLASGVYFCQLQTGEYTGVQKMVLMK